MAGTTDDWQTRLDMDTLRRAEEIKADAARHRAAKAHAGKKAAKLALVVAPAPVRRRPARPSPPQTDKRPVKKTGTFEGKSNRLGHGGRSAQLRAQGVPGAVIGKLARAAGTAPGQKNYHHPSATGRHIGGAGRKK